MGNFSERLTHLPVKPGVYLMKDKSGKIIYIGKASVIRNRVRSYFQKKANLPPKIQRMVSAIDDFEFIITESELEAFLLESNLIKQNQPRFNARLKDGKSYPFIKIDTAEQFPQVYITRKLNNDGSRYFGPYANAGSVRKTLGLLKKLFPYRSCTKHITGKDERPCLDYHINRCVGPCTGAVDADGYNEVIQQVIMFMEGKTDDVTKKISQNMHQASEDLDYERAAILRDQLTAIEQIHEKQKVINVSGENIDVIAGAKYLDQSRIEVFFVRKGKLVGRDQFIMQGTSEDSNSEILSAFITQFYSQSHYIPSKILLPEKIPDIEQIAGWLSSKKTTKVNLTVPYRGEKKRLLGMVEENAKRGLEQLKLKQIEEGSTEEALSQLQEDLNLPRIPRRIETYDISNIQGSNSTGSMVVFENGKPNKSEYRRFIIRNVKGIDDYSMMKEVLTRRFKKLSENLSESNSWVKIPDLVLIDGGKGHLGAALQVFLELGVKDIPLASIAKQEEEVFVPETPEPIILDRSSQALYLLQRSRDEAHRFAITLHRKRRSKSSTASKLDSIPGIGPQRRKQLLRKFGSTKMVQQARIEDIASLPGFNISLAGRIKDRL
ncbi:MAG: excinuclease ABC subunit UvrC [Chloroflexota bacterium]|jgi:excinuclease ABC subunit C|tara:strand:+ start:18335 stop:20152 length:1818 start_codon:yes stop_codon:yes gene_type:complete